MSLFGTSSKRALVVAPHADDEVLGAGGTIARLADEGWEVHVLVAVLAGFASLNRGDASETPERERELEKALAVLGATSHECLFRGETHHLRLDALPQSELVGRVEAVVAEQRPSLAILPGLGDHHQDHRAVARACITALRPAPEGARPFVPVVLAYGQTGAAGWGGEAYRFQPNAFVDIGGVLDRKLDAMRCYASQLCEPPHARSPEGIRTAAAAVGALAGCAFAEGFECLRHVTR